MVFLREGCTLYTEGNIINMFFYRILILVKRNFELVQGVAK